MLCDSEAGGPRHPGPWPTVCGREIRGCPERRGRCRDAEAAGDVVGCEKNPADECTDETSIRVPNRSHINEPSPPRIRRRTCRTNPFSTIPKVAFVFFFQYFMVELG